MGKTIEIELDEYKRLLKLEAKLEILKEMNEKNLYLTSDDFRNTLGIKEKSNENE